MLSDIREIDYWAFVFAASKNRAFQQSQHATPAEKDAHIRSFVADVIRQDDEATGTGH